MFLLDDVLLKPFTSILTVIQAMAVEELYDREEIRNDMKENRLLFELGERSRTEYERRSEELQIQLDVANQAHETLSNKIQVKQ
ncbi:gas vesicle protein GvpG [Halocatena salina]|uniref:Gas vesicle protein GvpG n=1 Tax=Halocatena salina TaxID=2934340 RepID=A0A8U0A7T5_9EURY|nr:gas vesicle protein GvpG [Halocatena salina]UPM45054.1 gas vesicle protein GvpG [Halocatena salina]